MSQAHRSREVGFQMKLIKSLVFKVVAVMVFLFALLAAADNSQKVALTFVDVSTPELSLFWWVLMAFVTGGVFSALINTWINASLRLAVRKANSEVNKTNQSIDQARAENGKETELDSAT